MKTKKKDEEEISRKKKNKLLRVVKTWAKHVNFDINFPFYFTKWK